MRQLDERQRQLLLHGVFGAFIALVVIFLSIISVQVLVGHALFVDETLMIALPLTAVLMSLVGYEILQDIYLGQQRGNLLILFAGVFSWTAVEQWFDIYDSYQRGIADVIFAHDQVQFGALIWLMAIAWSSLAGLAWFKVMQIDQRLPFTKLQAGLALVWVILLVITLWLRAHVGTIRTPVMTTIGNFVLAGLPLAGLSLIQTPKRWYWIAAWAWLGLWVYLSWFH
ncbi:hypothetical protein [Lacticaseibacillus porcinae]|uniref:hypothetical protein n=1 Tax=Lacticaseibacillus porcinae TaxID=1123687 RepID=UPI000F7AD09E|nr:hypothetical protein [Lacticaseibacillus porcinae]